MIGNECEDNNTVSGDGCSSTCQVEQGYTCKGNPPQTCETTCLDSIKGGKEECDDGNLIEDDGCNT